MRTLIALLLLAALSCKSEGPRSGSATSSAAEQPRMIVRTANMRIVVKDTREAVDAVTKSVEGAGGFVSDSNVWRDGDVLRARLTLRVPSDKLAATLASLRGMARRVESESVTSEDASTEYVDLDARVRNLEATETELRELLTVARRNTRKASEVLEVHQQLTAIRGEIEQTRGRMRHLSQVTTLSAIAVEISPDALPVWHPAAVARDATRALVIALQALATLAIWLLVCGVPIAALIALIWKVLRSAGFQPAVPPAS
ncbi:MAG TPA: DUF4349 domain-containing protein, partial [Thermoanaerobaculia bacterium]|nr:DUF4349 domain-containing protein [Thermoanaerobaculia bacterium]